MTDLNNLISNSKANIFRRCYIKRRNPAGGYEADWLNVTKYVKKWGSISYSLEDEKLNLFKLNGISMKMRNDEGVWSPAADANSFFKDYLTGYKTKFKIEAGYYDEDRVEYPTDPTLFLGIMTDEFTLNNKNEANFKVKTLMSVFDDIPASKLTGLTGSQTASEIIEQIRDMTDGSSNYLFRDIFTLTAWDIQTTTGLYPSLDTSTALNDDSCWKLMNNLATSEGKALWVDRLGSLYFKDKDTTQSTPIFELSGVGVVNPTYGHSIISIDSFKEAFNKVYTRVRVKFDEADTETSYYTKEESWSIGDSSPSYYYGQRTYNVNNEWLNTATAQAVGDNLFNDLSVLKQEVRLTTKFIPHLNPFDMVSVDYVSAEKTADGSFWDVALWDVGTFSESRNIFSISGNFGIRGMEIDIDSLKTKFFLRGV